MVSPAISSGERAEIRTWVDALTAISSAVNHATPLDEILDLVAATACQLMGYDFCAVLLPNERADVLVMRGSYGLSSQYVAEINVRRPIRLGGGALGDGPSTRAFVGLEAVCVNDIRAEPTFHPWGGVAREQGYRAVAAIPLVIGREAVGTLTVYRAEQYDFTPGDISLLVSLANQAAVAIETARLRDHEHETIADLKRLNASLRVQHELLEQAEQIHQKLTAVALRAGGVPAVATALAGLLTRPVLIDDATGHILARADWQGGSVDAPAAESTGGTSGRSVRAGFGEGLVEVTGWTGGTPNGPRVMIPVILVGEIVARIWLPGGLGDFGPVQRRAVEQAAVVTALELLRERTALEVEWRLRGDLLADLLAAEPQAMAAVVERAARLGHDLTAPHAAVAVRFDPVGTAEMMPEVRRLLSVVHLAVDRPHPRPLAGTREDYVTLLWPTDPRDPDARLIAERIQQAVGRAYPGSSLSIAVSRPCAQIADIPGAFRVVRGALELARMRGDRARIITVDDLGIYGLLLQLENQAELLRFAARTLAPLQEYDNKRGTSLVHTLRCHLATGLRTSQTAQRLFVHPNTVGLRIRRIEDLLGLSLADPNDLIAVTAALMAQDVADRDAP